MTQELSEETLQFTYTAWTNPRVQQGFAEKFQATTLPEDAHILAGASSFMMHLPHKNATAVTTASAASEDTPGIPFADPDGNLDPFALYGYSHDGSDMYGDFGGDVVVSMQTAAADDPDAAAAAKPDASGGDAAAASSDVGGFLMPPRMTQNDNNFVLRCEVPPASQAQRRLLDQQQQQQSHQDGGSSDKKLPRTVAYADWVRRILAFNAQLPGEPIVEASIIATPSATHVQCRILKHANCHQLPYSTPDQPPPPPALSSGGGGEPRHPRPAEELVSVVAEALLQKQNIDATVARLQAQYATPGDQPAKTDIRITRGVDVTGSGLGDDDDADDGIHDADDIPAIASVIVALQALAATSQGKKDLTLTTSATATTGSMLSLGGESAAQLPPPQDEDDVRIKVAQCRHWYEVRAFADYINVSWDDFRAVGLLCCQNLGGVLWMRVESWPTSSGARVRPALCVGVPMSRFVHSPPRACPVGQLPTVDPHGEVGCMRCRTCLSSPHLYSRQIGMYKQKTLYPRPQPRGFIAKMFSAKNKPKTRPAPYALRK